MSGPYQDAGDVSKRDTEGQGRTSVQYRRRERLSSGRGGSSVEVLDPRAKRVHVSHVETDD